MKSANVFVPLRAAQTRAERVNTSRQGSVMGRIEKSAERRISREQSLSLLVDLGVTYYRTRGEASARAFFDAYDVPAEITQRIFNTPGCRRKTLWERCNDEVALRRIFNAPPLL